jgi:hypothetical protein
MANSLGNCIGIKENILEAFILAGLIVKKGIMRDIPMDTSTHELLERIRIKNPSLHVTGAKRLQMLTEEHTSMRHRNRGKQQK